MDKNESNNIFGQDKKLYTCKYEIDADECRKLAKYFPEKFLFSYILYFTFCSIVLSLIFSINSFTVFSIIICFVFF